MSSVSRQEYLDQMRRDWEERARKNARYFVNTAQTEWTDEEFFHTGELTVAHQILNDMINICQGKDPTQMRVLEIGCGAGRVTRALARLFGQVYAVDISAGMVRQAREAVAPFPNVRIEQNNGRDLAVLGDIEVDFAFSTIVFQHIPSKDVIECYVAEVARLLRPRGLFKFQLQGYTDLWDDEIDTWLGVPFSDDEVVGMGLRNGFEPRYRYGAGTQNFWIWYFKRWRPRQLAIYHGRRVRKYFSGRGERRFTRLGLRGSYCTRYGQNHSK